jgi:hypothetical protein
MAIKEEIMNGLTIVILAVAAVFAAAICGMKLVDMLLGRVRSLDMIIAAVLGAVAFAAGSAALKMAAAAIAGT